MPAFVAELRSAQSLAFQTDPDDFVAELRPRLLDFDSSCEQTMEPETMSASDDALFDLLSTQNFSREKLSSILRSSILTLTRKLLTGKDVAGIDGHICVSFHDNRESPLFVDISSAEPRSEGCCLSRTDNCSPMSDVSFEMRDCGGHTIYPEFRRGGVVSPADDITSLKSVNPTPPLPVQSDDETSLEALSVQQRKVYPRRDSDADSGYSCGKTTEEMETDERRGSKTYLALPSPDGRRSCASVDSMCSILGPDMRAKREPSCEKSVAGVSNIEPDHKESGEDFDDESPALIIDENYDADDYPKNPETKEENEGGNPLNDEAAVTVTKNPEQPLALMANQDQNEEDENTTSGSSKTWAPFPVDLSGDSESPSGERAPIMLCGRIDVDGLVCRLCHAVTRDVSELSRHALYTHKLFTCTRCFLSFREPADLEHHMERCVGADFTQHRDSEAGRVRQGEIENAEAMMEASSTPAYNTTDDDEASYDSTYGQLLDLSVKKPRESEVCDKQEEAGSDVSQHACAAMLLSRPGENVSRDGYVKPGPVNVPLTVRDLTTSFDDGNKENDTVRIKSECPEDISVETPQQQQCHHHCHQQRYTSPMEKSLLVVPNLPRWLPEPPSPRPRSAEGRIPVARSTSILASRAAGRFSPYTREKLAEVAVKFLASRREGAAASGRATVAPGDMHSTTTRPSQGDRDLQQVALAAVAAKLNGEISREASLSETTLKNRVNAFVKRGGHHAHTGALALSGAPLADSSCSGHNSAGADAGQAATADQSARQRSDHKLACRMVDCHREFASFEELERHSVKSHGRYLCEYCDKSFTARPNRDRHARYHTGERPYKCDLCPLAFFRGDDLKYHRTTRHPAAEPFVCSACNRSFTWSRDLERHIKRARCKGSAAAQ